MCWTTYLLISKTVYPIADYSPPDSKSNYIDNYAYCIDVCNDFIPVKIVQNIAITYVITYHTYTNHIFRLILYIMIFKLKNMSLQLCNAILVLLQVVLL